MSGLRSVRMPWTLWACGSMQPYAGYWNGPRMAGLALLSLLVPLAEQVFHHGMPVARNLLLAAAITFGWQMLFARLRNRPMAVDGLVTAAVFTVLVAPETPWPRIAIALSFGVIAGEQIFGGRGRNFLNPVVVGLAFLYFSFPGSARDPAEIAVLAVAPAVFLMTASGLLSWRVLVAATCGYLVSLVASGAAVDAALRAPGLFLFAVTFLVGDAVCSAATRPGRWIYGFLAGALTVVLSPAPNLGVAVDALVFSALLASIFAPLVDHLVVSASVWRQGRRHG